MNQNKDKRLHLTAKQLKAIQAILTADTMENAAEEAGVTRNTLYRWLRDDLFAQELNLAKRQIVRQGIMRLHQATRDAVKTLLEICRDVEAPASSRVAAAREILNNTLKSIELENIDDRTVFLSRRVKKLKEDFPGFPDRLSREDAEQLIKEYEK